MELNSHKKWMISPLDNFWQTAIWLHTRNDHASRLKLVTISDIHLITMAVTFRNHLLAIKTACGLSRRQMTFISAKTHGTAKIIIGTALQGFIANGPFGNQTDKWQFRIAKFT